VYLLDSVVVVGSLLVITSHVARDGRPHGADRTGVLTAVAYPATDLVLVRSSVYRRDPAGARSSTAPNWSCWGPG
jgi:hypothetical protein